MCVYIYSEDYDDDNDDDDDDDDDSDFFGSLFMLIGLKCGTI